MSQGFIKLQRAAEELFENDLDAYLLLTQIAFRALRQKSKFNKHKLQPNQALVGDFETCHLTEKRYRTAKDRLENLYKIVAFKGTNKGTIATLLNTEIYDINSEVDGEQKGEPRADQGRTEGEPRATKEECKKERKEECKKKQHLVPTAEAEGLASLLLTKIKEWHPTAKDPNLNTWAKDIDRMIRIDKREPEEIKGVIFWLPSCHFWRKNVLSADKLRSQFDRLLIEKSQPDKPKRLSRKEQVEQKFQNYGKYSGATCYITDDVIAFERTMTHLSVNFKDPAFDEKLNEILGRFSIHV